MEFILNDTGADNLILDIQSLKEDKERFTIIANQQIKVITDKLEAKNKTIDDGIEFNKSQLRAFFLTVDKKSTKTQESYSLLSGKLVMKKETIKFKHDDEQILRYCNSFAKQYVKSTVKESLNWSELKGNILIHNGMIVDAETGEIIDIDGLSLEKVEPRFDIK